MSDIFHEGQTFRTQCKRGRITYHPEWSEFMPWVSYIDGSAGMHFSSTISAVTYFKRKGMKLILDDTTFRAGKPLT